MPRTVKWLLFSVLILLVLRIVAWKNHLAFPSGFIEKCFWLLLAGLFTVIWVVFKKDNSTKLVIAGSAIGILWFLGLFLSRAINLQYGNSDWVEPEYFKHLHHPVIIRTYQESLGGGPCAKIAVVKPRFGGLLHEEVAVISTYYEYGKYTFMDKRTQKIVRDSGVYYGSFSDQFLFDLENNRFFTTQWIKTGWDEDAPKK